METYGFGNVHLSNIFSKRFRKLFLGRAFPVIMKTDLVHVENLGNISVLEITWCPNFLVYKYLKFAFLAN